MGFADQAWDAMRRTNFIEALPEAATQLEAGPRHAPDSPNGSVAPPPHPDKAAPPQAKRPTYSEDPDTVTNAYYVEQSGGERRYFDDYQRRALAMRATQDAVSSKREDLTTIRAMLDIAQARGWQSVNIRGSTSFRREAWIEATARGLEGQGYSATDPDRQESARRRKEQGRSNSVSNPTPPTPAAKVLAEAPGRATNAQVPSKPAKTSADPVIVKTNGAVGVSMTPTHPPTDKEAPANSPSDLHRKTLRAAKAELSSDGRLILEALSKKIDREMVRFSSQGKTEIKAFAATALVKQEQQQGPVVLSAKQRQAAALQPAPIAPKREEMQAPARTRDAEAPRRTLSR